MSNLSRFILLFLTIGFPGIADTLAQTPATADSASLARIARYKYYRDSAYLAQRQAFVDSLSKRAFFKTELKGTTSPIIDSILAANTHKGVTPLTIGSIIKKGNSPQDLLKLGNYLPKGEIWSLAFIGSLLLLFSVLRYSFSRQLLTIIQSFFSNRILSNLNKEDSLFTSWPFLLLFVLFGFVIGMFYYLVTQYYELAAGFQYFVTISVLIVVLYALKIIVLKVMGFFFNVKKPVHDYITILYLSYFNAGLLFLPLVVAFVLSPLKFGIYFIVASYIILGTILGLQFVRAGLNILSDYRFSKLYLLLYFCALEICPIIILIKAIRY